MGPSWDNVGTMLGQCWDNFEVIMGQFLGQFWDSFRTSLGQLFEILPYHFFAFPPPAITIKVDTGWGTEKSFFVAVGFLSHFGVKHYYDHVATFA